MELLPTIPGVLTWTKALMDDQGWQEPLGEAAMEKYLNSQRFPGLGIDVEETVGWN